MASYQGESAWKWKHCSWERRASAASAGAFCDSSLLLYGKSPLPTRALTVYPPRLSYTLCSFRFPEVFSAGAPHLFELGCLISEMSKGVLAGKLSPQQILQSFVYLMSNCILLTMHDFDKAKLCRWIGSPSLHTSTAHFIRLRIALASLWGLGLWDNGVLMLHKIRNGFKSHYFRCTCFTSAFCQLAHCFV